MTEITKELVDKCVKSPGMTNILGAFSHLSNARAALSVESKSRLEIDVDNVLTHLDDALGALKFGKIPPNVRKDIDEIRGDIEEAIVTLERNRSDTFKVIPMVHKARNATFDIRTDVLFECLMTEFEREMSFEGEADPTTRLRKKWSRREELHDR